MNYKEVIAQFNQKKVKDYSFTVVFFILFSVFVIFAIRPNILTAFELRNELAVLKLKDKEYEELIKKIVEHQSILEAQRGNLHTLDEAVPQKYILQYQLIDDITMAATDSGVVISELRTPEQKLVTKEKDSGFKEIPITLSVGSDQSGLTSYLKSFLTQRRLKQLVSLTMDNKSKSASESAVWESNLELNSFYYKQ